MYNPINSVIQHWYTWSGGDARNQQGYGSEGSVCGEVTIVDIDATLVEQTLLSIPFRTI